MLASVGLGFVLLLILFRLSYSYMVVFAPFIAYAIARVTYPWKSNISPLMALLLVSLIAVPVIDLTWSIQARPNQAKLDTIDVLSPQFPSGTTIVGEDIFWFTLHDQHPYIGINGFYNYIAIKNTDILAALKQLKVDALLCDKSTTSCQMLVDTGYFDLPTENKIGDSNYLIYWSKRG
jgi:hypothetical protein